MLLNVRLAREDEALVRRLRERGINISDVVRAAIRAEAALRAGPAVRDAVDLVNEIIARHPAPKGTRREQRPPLDDRRAVAGFIERRLKKGSR